MVKSAQMVAKSEHLSVKSIWQKLMESLETEANQFWSNSRAPRRKRPNSTDANRFENRVVCTDVSKLNAAIILVEETQRCDESLSLMSLR